MDFECNKCHKLFRHKSKLQRHLDNVCVDKSIRYPCTLCAKTFCSELKVKRHVYESHVKKLKELGSDTHMLSKIKQATQIKVKKTAILCYEEGCTDTNFPSLKRFRKHLTEIHGKEITKSTYQFSSLEEFNIWKESIEKEIGICYSGLSGRKKDGNKIMQTYYCRRSGVPRMRGTGKKKPKAQGSCKIGYYCSSTIELCIMEGTYYVTYYEEHNGHDLDVPSLAHTPIPKSDKKFIAGLLSNDYSIEEIMQMAQDGFKGRLALIKPSDIKNIARSFKIKNKTNEYLEDKIFSDINDFIIKSEQSSADEDRIQDTEDPFVDDYSFDDNDDEQCNDSIILSEIYNTFDLTDEEVVNLAANIINDQINSKATIPDLLLRFISGLVKNKHHQLKIGKSITEAAQVNIKEAAQHTIESKFVPGRVAVCVHCGILSEDLNICQKCRIPFANAGQMHSEGKDNTEEVVNLAANIINDQIINDQINGKARISDHLLKFLSGLVEDKHQIKIAKSITEAAQNSIKEAAQHTIQSKFVPGRVAVCVHCGILSADLNICQNCRTPFTNAGQTHSEGRDNSDMLCKARIHEDIFTIDNKNTFSVNDGLALKVEYDCESDPQNNTIFVKEQKISKSFCGKPRTNKKSQRKVFQPISQVGPIITVDLDTFSASNGMPLKLEYDYENDPKNHPIFVKYKDSKAFKSLCDEVRGDDKPKKKVFHPISHLEPVITAEMDNMEENTVPINMGTGKKTTIKEFGSSIPDFDSLTERTLCRPNKSYKYLTCRSIWIGSYKVVPTEDVYFTPEGITLKIPPTGHNEKEIVTVHIPIKKVVKILAHTEGNPPVIFLYVTPSIGRNICDTLKMTDKKKFYFDPCSSDESHKRITILPKTRLDRDIFEEIIYVRNASNLTSKSQSSSQLSKCILEELNEIEANKLLVLSS